MCEKKHLDKLEKYCAYQERCHQEVRSKAKEIGVPLLDIDLALLHLIKTNFLNEERFTNLYVRSKMNQKRWGPKKIESELRRKQISPNLIRQTIFKLPPQDFRNNLKQVAEKFLREKKVSTKHYLSYKKLIRHLIYKGYSYDMIKETLGS